MERAETKHVVRSDKIDVYVDTRCWHGEYGGWLKWVQVGPSPISGQGVFTARLFEKGDSIGMYTGHVVGPFPRLKRLRTSRELKAERETARLHRGGASMLMGIKGIMVDGSRPPQAPSKQIALCGKVLFPRRFAWPGIYAHLMNSSWDMRTGKREPSRENCVVNLHGEVIATRDLKPGTELLMDYGEEYYVAMGQDGTKDHPIEL